MIDDCVDKAIRFLRQHTTADIRFDEHIRPIKYVFAPDGRLVAPVMVAMLETFDTVLFIPETVDECMELQVTLERFKESGPMGALCDRWRIHHGDPPDLHWALMHPDAGRFDRAVIDGEAFLQTDPLAAAEPGLCRLINDSYRGVLAALCTQHAGVTPEEPLAVAVDRFGFLVRGRFDCLRVFFPEPVDDESEAVSAIQRLAATAEAP
jgi:hypothetical protein